MRTILGGIDAYRDQGGPYMPAFEDTLTKAQIADLARYIRARFSDESEWSDIEATLDKAMSDQGEGDGK